MPDEKGNTEGSEETIPQTPLHAYAEGREEDVEGSIPDGDKGAEDATKTGGATSGGPPREAGTPNDQEGAEAENVETNPPSDSDT